MCAFVCVRAVCAFVCVRAVCACVCVRAACVIVYVHCTLIKLADRIGQNHLHTFLQALSYTNTHSVLHTHAQKRTS